MLEFIKSKEVTSNDGHKSASLFEKLINMYSGVYEELMSLKLFFSKLEAAIKSPDQTAEDKIIVAAFIEQVNAEPSPYHKSILDAIIDLSSAHKDRELLQQFIRIIGVSALDNTVRRTANPDLHKNYQDKRYNTQVMLELMSTDALNEVVLIPAIQIKLTISRNALLIILTRVSGDTFNALIQQTDFISHAMLYLNPHELQELLFSKMNNYLLGQVMSKIFPKEVFPGLPTCWSSLMKDEQGSVVFNTIIRRLSPFALSEALPLLDTYIKYSSTNVTNLEKHKKNCNDIISFITAPKNAIKKNKLAFLAFLAFHLNSKDQIIVDAPKWLKVLKDAEKSCQTTDSTTLALLNQYIWTLQKRPECGVSEEKFSATQTTWFQLKAIAPIKQPNQVELPKPTLRK
jgi:hypothetical protein